MNGGLNYIIHTAIIFITFFPEVIFILQKACLSTPGHSWIHFLTSKNEECLLNGNEFESIHMFINILIIVCFSHNYICSSSCFCFLTVCWANDGTLEITACFVFTNYVKLYCSRILPGDSARTFAMTGKVLTRLRNTWISV